MELLADPGLRVARETDRRFRAGIGLNRLGALVDAPALLWSLQRPPSGAAAAFRGQVEAQFPEDQVGPSSIAGPSSWA